MEINQPNVPVKVCDKHDIFWVLMGEPCPNCARLSLSAYESKD